MRQSTWSGRQNNTSPAEKSGVDLAPRERSLIGSYRSGERAGVGALLRTSIYCTAIAGLFLYLALTRDEPRYAIGIFVMFLFYLAIRVYSAKRVAGIMPRIVQRYENRIAELEQRVNRISPRNV